MQALRSAEQDAAGDLVLGQLVIIVARYFLIAGVLGVLLWDISDSTEMAAAVAPMAAFLAINFFLHARYLTEEPANLSLTALTGMIDLILVTSIIVAWPGSTGMQSPFFVLYYPLIVAFAFVTSRRIDATYTMLAVALYVSAVLQVDGVDVLADATDLKTLVLRVITLAATGGIANHYWRRLRARRRPVVTSEARRD